MAASTLPPIDLTDVKHSGDKVVCPQCKSARSSLSIVHNGKVRCASCAGGKVRARGSQ